MPEYYSRNEDELMPFKEYRKVVERYADYHKMRQNMLNGKEVIILCPKDKTGGEI